MNHFVYYWFIDGILRVRLTPVSFIFPFPLLVHLRNPTSTESGMHLPAVDPTKTSAGISLRNPDRNPAIPLFTPPTRDRQVQSCI